MIDPEHIAVSVKRIEIPPGKLDVDEESAAVAAFHAISLMATYRDWSEFFTFVALTDDREIDHISIDVMDASPEKWIGTVVEAALRHQKGHYMAVSINMGAFSAMLTKSGELVDMESKFCITVPASGNILVSRLHRNVETKEMENDGKWDTKTLNESTLDGDGVLDQTMRHLQEVIQEERARR